MRQIKFSAAIREAIFQTMEEDSSVFIFGEGVDDPKVIFETTQGLKEKFGSERVFDMPLSESGMTGVAVGSALSGMRPIMTHQRIDFALYAMDQIVNHAAKRHYSSGGSQCVPLTIRMIVGRGWGQGSQHSQSLQALFAHIPGLKVIMPSTPYDVKGLLISAIKDSNPVMFIEYRRLFDDVGEVPEDTYVIPIGQGVIRQKGKDLTIVGHSYMMKEAMRALPLLHQMGVEPEIIDLRTIKPLDESLILNSVKKTGRLLVLDTSWKSFGIAAEIMALAVENCFSNLKTAAQRICLPDVPTPTTHVLEKKYYPDHASIVQCVGKIMGLHASKLPAEIVAGGIETKTKEGNFVGPF